MVVTKQMQNPVQKKKVQLTLERGLCLGSIPCRRFSRDYDIAEKIRLNPLTLAFLHGKGDNVGRTILIQVITIDVLDRLVIDNQD